MKKLTVNQIKEGTGGRLLNGNAFDIAENICTDSRIAQAGDVFFALTVSRDMCYTVSHNEQRRRILQ